MRSSGKQLSIVLATLLCSLLAAYFYLTPTPSLPAAQVLQAESFTMATEQTYIVGAPASFAD